MQADKHEEAWGLSRIVRWDANLEAGAITFTLDDDTVATAPMQVIGTYDTENENFLWGWDHPSVPGPLRRAAAAARDWGAEQTMVEFTHPRLNCPIDIAWEFTAVAARLDGANGAFLGESGPTRIFMTFGPITLSKVH